MRNLTTRVLLGAAVLGLAASLPLSQAQAAFPERNINIIVPFSPGGGYDAIARATARSMKKFLPKGVNVIVKNVTGAAGRRAAVFMYRAKPDGYTIAHFQASGMLGDQMLSETPVGFETSQVHLACPGGRGPLRSSRLGQGPLQVHRGPAEGRAGHMGGRGHRRGTVVGLVPGSQGVRHRLSTWWPVIGARASRSRRSCAATSTSGPSPSTTTSVTSYLGTDLRPVAQLDRKRAVNAPGREDFLRNGLMTSTSATSAPSGALREFPRTGPRSSRTSCSNP